MFKILSKNIFADKCQQDIGQNKIIFQRIIRSANLATHNL